MAKKAPARKRLEDRTQQIGHELFDSLNSRAPSIFHGRWWEDRLLHWAMSDESIKVQLFRFIEVLPMLKTHEAIARHLDEYFECVRAKLPAAVRLGLEVSAGNSVLSRALAWNARINANRMARRFIAGTSSDEIIQSALRLRRNGLACCLEHLNAAVLSDDEADHTAALYHDRISSLAEALNPLPDDSILDHDHEEPLPRAQVNLKLTALDGRFSVIDSGGTQERILERLRPILRNARENDAAVHFEMEQSYSRPLVLETFQTVLQEDEFRDWPHCGIVLQSYRRDCEQDLKALLKWVKKRGTPITVRLVKGAYRDHERVVAARHNWPLPVYLHKCESDQSFEKQTDYLMKNHTWLRPAIASHNIRSLAHALASADLHGVPERASEIQMLFGISDAQAQVIAERGHRVRIQAPSGDLIPGLSRLVRRFLENTSNDSFLRQSFAEHRTTEALLMSPTTQAKDVSPAEKAEAEGFRNEPATDFSSTASREAMQDALASVRDSFGGQYSLIIDGKACDSRATLDSRNPSRTSEIIGRVAAANADQAVDAIDAARRAFPGWAATDVATRIEYLELIAAEMRERRFELAAWMIYECGKPWQEADADVTEAIDFCMYYADQMKRLEAPLRCDLPGEENSYFYRPRGVAVVISPWNFPLAVLAGMTAAAMVAGNTVIMKPAEQSSVVAARFMDIIRNAHVPDGVVNFLPGVGEELGPILTGSPQVDIVAFTGSLPVGLEVNQIAAETGDHQPNVRKVIVEMGGKNAIIVDNDADIDDAVAGVIHSAFSYAGQKCSACSRVIVLEGCYDQFVERLIAATKNLTVGPAEDPATVVGPVIDQETVDRIQSVLDRVDPESDGQLALAVDTEALSEQGYFVGPRILIDVEPSTPAAQEEIFGPVLAVIRARDMDQAFEIANGTRFALAGGIYSRSPASLRRARVEFQVGNLYLNREITGALVGRQPFGGYRMSGTGSKAGGPDYLQQFMVPVNITENTTRNGFAEDSEAAE